MAELRIHDQSSIYFKSIRTGDTPKDINVKIPDKSGWLITDTTLQEILNSGANIASSQILKPDITETPLVNPEAYADLLPIATYRTNDTFVGEHQATEWVASLVPDFSTIIDSTADPLFRDGWYPAVNEANKKVYVKYRFISEDICSPFSDTLEFTTPAGGVAIPTLSVVEDGSTPLIKGSEFRLFGNLTGVTHVGSSWKIIKVSDNTVVKDISNSPEHLREYKVEGLLQPETEYKISLVYHTSHPVFSKTRKAIGTYKTPASTIARPTLTFTTAEGRYEINGTAFVVNSGTDRHKFTTWVVKNGTGAVIYREDNSKELTRLNLTGILEPDNDYRVTAIYIGDKSRSNEGAINFRTPAEDQTDLNKLITITKETHGGVKLTMEKFKMPVAENLLYLTWTIQNFNNNNPIALEVRLDKELDDKYDQELVYDLVPTDSWLKWMPNNEIVNPVIKLSAKGRVVGEKTVLNYATQLPLECTFEYIMGEMSIEDNDTLNPLIKITEPTGADSNWIAKRDVEWALYRKGSNVPAAKAITNDYGKHRFTNIDFATDYVAKCTYKTNFGNWEKTFDFRSRPFTLPKPVVDVVAVGPKATIRAGGDNLTLPGHPEKSHGSTTWTLYSNAGTILWQSIKNTANLLSIDIPKDKLERATEYKVGVIFHSTDDTISSVETVVNYSHLGSILVVADEDFSTGTHDKVMLTYGTIFYVKKVQEDVGNGTLQPYTDPVRVGVIIKDLDDDSVVWNRVFDNDRSLLALLPNGVKYAAIGQVNKYTPLKKNSYKVILNVYAGTEISSTKVFTLNVKQVPEYVHLGMTFLDNAFNASYKEEKYGTFAKGGLFRTETGNVMAGAGGDIDTRTTGYGLNVYTGEWGNENNRIRSYYAREKVRKHFSWKAGQMVSKKGKLYTAKIDQAWNQYDPEADRDAWQNIESSWFLPNPMELLDAMGLNWGCGEGTAAFGYSDRKWSNGDMIGKLPTRYSIRKMVSPTTKRVAYVLHTDMAQGERNGGLVTMCWNDIVARQPEYTEVDRFTLLFGTTLCWVRIATKEEAELIIATNTTGNKREKIAYCQRLAPGVETVKALSVTEQSADGIKFAEVDVNIKDRSLECYFVVTPVPHGEEPYLTSNLTKMYPNITYPEGELSWSTEGLTYGEDTNYFPEGLKLAYDQFTDTGYFGRIPVTKFKTYAALLTELGVTNASKPKPGTGVDANDVKYYDMFYYHGLIQYIPNTAAWDTGFDEAKRLGLVYGTNMGAYHRYVGDVKLENAKDNWYRIGVMSVNRWNIFPFFGDYDPSRKKLLNRNIGEEDDGFFNPYRCFPDAAYSKIFNHANALDETISDGVRSVISDLGRKFTIKNRGTVNIVCPEFTQDKFTEFSKDIYIVDTGVPPTKSRLLVTSGLSYSKRNHIEETSCFTGIKFGYRPMLTLKPVGGLTV